MRLGLKRTFQFKVTLQEVQPPVWRRIQVPASYSFWDLHVAIQDAMGWDDYHLHEFKITNPTTGARELIGIPDDECPEERPTLPGWTRCIAAYFVEERTRASYAYDFGDGWMHAVVLEKVSPRAHGDEGPVCLGGVRACPPEDCGGPGGYERFLEAIRDPEHPEHDQTVMWIGGSFDPEHFDPTEVEFDDPLSRWMLAFATPEEGEGARVEGRAN